MGLQLWLIDVPPIFFAGRSNERSARMFSPSIYKSSREQSKARVLSTSDHPSYSHSMRCRHAQLTVETVWPGARLSSARVGRCMQRSLLTDVLQWGGEAQQDAVVGVVGDGKRAHNHSRHGVQGVGNQQVGGESPPVSGEERLGPALTPLHSCVKLELMATRFWSLLWYKVEYPAWGGRLGAAADSEDGALVSTVSGCWSLQSPR